MSVTTMSATMRLCEYLDEVSFDRLPSEVVQKAKDFVLDYIGYTTFGIEEPAPRILGKVFRQIGGAEECTIIGQSWKLPSVHAAFLNGATAHVTELDDTDDSTGSHPGDSIIPAALAVAEKLGTDGKTFIAALVAGYEAMIRIGYSVMPSHDQKGWHTSSTLTTLGAAVAAAKQMNMSPGRLAQTLSIAVAQMAGNSAHVPERGMLKDFNPGRAAGNGVFAALLGAEGFTGASDVIENPHGFAALYSDEFHPERIGDGLGDEYRILKVAHKLFPGCRYLHRSREAALILKAKHGIQPSEVQRVVARINTRGAPVVDDAEPWAPGKGAMGPRFSAQFNVALALIEGEEGMWRLFDIGYPLKRLEDPEVRSMIGRIQLIHDDEFNKGYPMLQPSAVEVETDRGTFSHRVDHCKGDPDNPMTAGEFERKFRVLTSQVFSPARQEEIQTAVADLEKVPNMAEFTALLKPSA